MLVIIRACISFSMEKGATHSLGTGFLWIKIGG
jgi:hypothetical protein